MRGPRAPILAVVAFPWACTGDRDRPVAANATASLVPLADSSDSRSAADSDRRSRAGAQPGPLTKPGPRPGRASGGAAVHADPAVAGTLFARLARRPPRHPVPIT